MTDANEFVHLQDAKSFSRLLYTNPVCLLATLNPSATPTPTRNVMVISWLTPTNNSGKFVMSVNKRRHTAGILVPNDNSNGDSNNNNVELTINETSVSIPPPPEDDEVEENTTEAESIIDVSDDETTQDLSGNNI